MADKCIWTGASGKKYEYGIYPIDTQWKDIAGNYIFAREASSHEWEAIYR